MHAPPHEENVIELVLRGAIYVAGLVTSSKKSDGQALALYGVFSSTASLLNRAFSPVTGIEWLTGRLTLLNDMNDMMHA